jgi:hypothetical protein
LGGEGNKRKKLRNKRKIREKPSEQEERMRWGDGGGGVNQTRVGRT